MQALEKCRLAAVSAQIAAVEEPATVGLDEQRVGVEGAVVDEERRDGERPDLDRLAIGEEAAGSRSRPRGVKKAASRRIRERCRTHI